MTSETCNTVDRVFAKAFEKWPDRPMLNVMADTARVLEIDAGEMTYAQAGQIVREWQVRFEHAGYGPGMRVAVLLENRPEYFLIWLALNRIGASVVPINPDLKAGELQYLIGHCKPALVITIPKRLTALREAVASAEISATAITPSQDLPKPRQDASVARGNCDDENREAALLYTSGTTGHPKGCVLSNRYFLELADWYQNMGEIAALDDKGERMITPLPLFHMNAMACSFMVMIRLGGCLTVLDRFHPKTWWSDVRQSRATCLHYLGVMPSILMGLEPTAQDRDHAVRFGFGAGIDPKIHAAFEDRFGFPLVEGWAMTETGAGAVITNHTHDRLVGQSALGRVPDWLETRLVDELDRDVPVGMPGELLVRRRGDDPHVGFFTEYYQDPDETTRAWKDGWFHTGDVVRMGSDGFMFFVDRRKNVIRRSGENIAAVEVESALMRHPDVLAVGVAPVPDDIRGDEVFAAIKARAPSAALAQEITEWALTQMAYYKVPAYISFVDALPLTATQKIQRAELKKLAAKLSRDAATYRFTHLKKRSVA